MVHLSQPSRYPSCGSHTHGVMAVHCLASIMVKVMLSPLQRVSSPVHTLGVFGLLGPPSSALHTPCWG